MRSSSSTLSPGGGASLRVDPIAAFALLGYCFVLRVLLFYFAVSAYVVSARPVFQQPPKFLLSVRYTTGYKPHHRAKAAPLSPHRIGRDLEKVTAPDFRCACTSECCYRPTALPQPVPGRFVWRTGVRSLSHWPRKREHASAHPSCVVYCQNACTEPHAGMPVALREWGATQEGDATAVQELSKFR